MINPDFRPIPPGTALFCAQQSNFSLVKLSHQYDPFDNKQNCTIFITWTQPTPHTIPLFVYDRGGQHYISLKQIKDQQYKHLSFSPIYVLDSKYNSFKGLQGICMPDKDGQTLGKCVALYNKGLLNPQKDETIYFVKLYR